MKDKILTTIVSRNNSILLQHLFSSIEKYDAGYEHEIIIADASSDNPSQLKLLESLSKKYTIQIVPNGRVESSYNEVWKLNKDYKYYFFMHDDMAVNRNDWLKVFVDRMNSGYCEKIIEGTHLRYLPIGKVSLGNQPWRGYDSILGYPVQCMFLKPSLELLRPGKVPVIFKMCDCDRFLVNNECLSSTNGFRHVAEFKELKSSNSELYQQLCSILNQYLRYPDEGMYPKTLYPAGECWNKLTLLSEFMNSTEPLGEGWRTVGLYDDGYLEQIHGFDVPIQHKYITHYGSPNFKEFMAKKLNSDQQEIKKRFNDKIFLMKCDKFFKEYLEKYDNK